MKKYLMALTLLTILNTVMLTSQAQSTVVCGDVFEAEIALQEVDTGHYYDFDANAGDTVNFSSIPFSNASTIGIYIYDPSGDNVANTNTFSGGEVASINNFIIPASGRYQLRVYERNERPAAYSICLGCTLRDGTVIEPGQIVVETDTSTDTSSTTSSSSSAQQPIFTGFGFPGLQAVDFSNGVTVPMQFGTPNVGSLSAGFQGIFGYSFNGQAGQALNLAFTRTSGNLNLNIALISADNQVIFQTVLVAGNTFTTSLILPVDGDYTLGVSIVDLVSPPMPENTGFRIDATLE